MKKILGAIFLGLFALTLATVDADAGGTRRTRGYTKKNGTYVAPHYSTKPNRTKQDNWSTKGNRNPYTGKKGTKKAY